MRPTPTRLAFALFLLYATFARAHEIPAEMLAAAGKFLGALTPEQKKLATYPLTDAERENWNFVPIARNGLSFKKTSTDVQALSLALLRTGLSHAGVAKAQAIMQLEFVLKELEQANPKQNRDPVNYFITIFGEPAADKSWGWRFEGHHLAFNFTVVDGKHVFFAPSFIGTNPAEVKAGPRKGERVLADEEDSAHAFMKSLDEAQRKLAIIADKAPNEIVTTNKKRVDPLSPTGISAAQLKPAQRDLLLAVARTYANRFRPELAEQVITRLAANPEKLTFAWAGGIERGGGATYYRIQSPDYLIEFDNSQNNANHIHSTFREFKGDFGHDLLAEHYAKAHAK
jgi:hypothetical protein